MADGSSARDEPVGNDHELDADRASMEIRLAPSFTDPDSGPSDP
jgi:hypothetical protein